MKTYTPREKSGKFESWNKSVRDAGSYNGQDAAIGLLVMALGALAWNGLEWAWEKATGNGNEKPRSS